MAGRRKAIEVKKPGPWIPGEGEGRQVGCGCHMDWKPREQGRGMKDYEKKFPQEADF